MVVKDDMLEKNMVIVVPPNDVVAKPKKYVFERGESHALKLLDYYKNYNINIKNYILNDPRLLYLTTYDYAADLRKKGYIVIATEEFAFMFFPDKNMITEFQINWIKENKSLIKKICELKVIFLGEELENIDDKNYSDVVRDYFSLNTNKKIR